MILVQHDYVIEVLSANRTDQSFDVRGLPGRPEGDEHFFYPQVLYTIRKERTVDAVPVPEQEPWNRLQWKRLDNLLSSPVGRRMARDVEADDPASVNCDRSRRSEHWGSVVQKCPGLRADLPAWAGGMPYSSIIRRRCGCLDAGRCSALSAN